MAELLFIARLFIVVLFLAFLVANFNNPLNKKRIINYLDPVSVELKLAF